MEGINKFFIENSNIKEINQLENIKVPGKVIYEVLRIIHGKPLFLENHLLRMENSFKLINIDQCLDNLKIRNDIENLVRENEKLEGNIKLTYNVNEKVMRIFFINHSYPNEEMYKNGVKTILYFGERENPNAKIVNLNFREKVNIKIKENNAYEAILVDRNGYITEGSKSNIFMVKENVLLTSPIKTVLPGVTRGEIINIAIENGIKVEEVSYKYSDIEKLDGMFISGTSPKILPINQVDSIKMNSNEIINKLIKCYNNKIIDYIKSK
ncbi:aminotransferase class IV [Clostridium botulinum]|uniref:Aminotransferase, class IV n=2 Tax=Clostridium botulinum TaxID=1491 RepID=B2TLE2_CLOBB|nr:MULTISPECIES: aminotransferase class IV [unclassified Clostridium]ACD23607.1 aminotransferase, class IV [Clostridium botulinum B str. Eklund 17B (NRP)]AIY80101.1 aminotransferase class IV family protein [Clostridium botulinum 202F]KAI3346506.1 aminotransferase class IV [Clostridium botulinum]KFX54796.1 aminotransferase, class IV [Clostridium botulinum]KFX58762.1 aminotransferase, class IV [Clostridium botulinum]